MSCYLQNNRFSILGCDDSIESHLERAKGPAHGRAVEFLGHRQTLSELALPCGVGVPRLLLSKASQMWIGCRNQRLLVRMNAERVVDVLTPPHHLPIAIKKSPMILPSLTVVSARLHKDRVGQYQGPVLGFRYIMPTLSVTAHVENFHFRAICTKFLQGLYILRKLRPGLGVQAKEGRSLTS